MPHYKNGTEAKVGDLVRGYGYNVKHEIIGKVVQVTADSDACNVAVAHVGHDSPVLFNDQLEKVRDNVAGHTQMNWGVAVMPVVEYGATKDFEKVSPDAQ